MTTPLTEIRIELVADSARRGRIRGETSFGDDVLALVAEVRASRARSPGGDLARVEAAIDAALLTLAHEFDGSITAATMPAGSGFLAARARALSAVRALAGETRGDALREPGVPGAIEHLVKAATGEARHRFEGLCPDAVNGPLSRDFECDVCHAIDTVAPALASASSPSPARPVKIERSKEWWLARADSEGDSCVMAVGGAARETPPPATGPRLIEAPLPKGERVARCGHGTATDNPCPEPPRWASYCSGGAACALYCDRHRGRSDEPWPRFASPSPARDPGGDLDEKIRAAAYEIMNEGWSTPFMRDVPTVRAAAERVIRALVADLAARSPGREGAPRCPKCGSEHHMTLERLPPLEVCQKCMTPWPAVEQEPK